MEKELDHQKELQLLPPPSSLPPLYPPSSRASLTWHHRYRHRATRSKPDPNTNTNTNTNTSNEPSLDLKLSISCGLPPESSSQSSSDYACVEALKWQAAEQIRLAAIEKAYAERVRELTRREIELAQSEFARARLMWDKAREEVARAERIRESVNTGGNTCMGEITCHSCRQRFHPSC